MTDDDATEATAGTSGDPAAGTSRRRFLAGAGATVAAAGAIGALGGTGPFGLPSLVANPAAAVAAAAPRTAGAGQLVVVFLRGGIDGLSLVVPAGDPDYFRARPTIAIPEAAVLPLDGFFGLHPVTAPIHGLFGDGRLALVHAVGNPARSRSHFEAMDLLEQGSAVRRSDGTGWLTRHLATTTPYAPDNGLFRAVAISANSPGSLRGSGSLSIPTLAGFGLGGASGRTAGWEGSFREAYAGSRPVEVTGTNTVQALSALGAVTAPPANAGAFADAAALLGAGLGVEVITIDVGGWDTHNAMGTHTAGEMRSHLDDLARGLAGFQADLDRRGLKDVTTVVMSEFGRRVAENASGGTDHGAGNMMLVMGAGLAGGKVHATWPGLAASQLDRGDVAITTDVRDVLWELTRDRLGNPDPGGVLQGHTPTPLGITV
jgi:uncharacterized protein (DUF1501 family)